MFGGLRKKLNEVWSGADFWDKKENQQQRQVFAQKRQQAAKPAPVRTVSQQSQQYAPATVQQRVDQSYGTGFSKYTNRLRDTFDANTKADKIRRFATTGLEETYDEEQARKTKEALASDGNRNSANQFSGAGLGNVVRRVGQLPGAVSQLQGRTIKAFNSIDNPILRTGAKLITPGGASMLFQDDKMGDKLLKTGQNANATIENKVQQSGLGDRKDDNKWIRSGGQLTTDLPLQIASGGAGLLALGAQTTADEANKAQAKGRSNEQALGIGALQGGATALSEKFGIDRFLPGQGSTAGLTTKLVNAGKRFVTEGAQEAQQQFTSNLIANKTYDPTQSLKEGVLQSAVMGGLAGGAMSPFADFSTSRPQDTPQVQRNARPEEYNVLSDYQETLYGNIPSGSLVNQIHKDARQVADRLGIDIVTGSPADISNRINEVLSRQPKVQSLPDAQTLVPGLTTALVKPKRSLFKPLNDQTGGGSLPILDKMNEAINGKNVDPVNKRMSDVDSSERGNLNQYKATKKVQYEQLKELKRQYKEGNIVTKGNLRVPLMMARSKYKETLESIKNAEKIIDDRAKELGQTTKLSKTKDPLESLKQEARKYKSAEEFFDNTWNRGLPTEDTVKFLDNTPDAKAWYKLLDEQKKSEPIARKALSDMESMRKKYVGKKNLKLTDAEKKSIDKQYNELAKTVQNHLDNYGGFNTNTGYVDGKGLLMESSTFDGATNAQKQLTDLYDQATQPPKSTPKTVEAKKPLSETEKADIQKQLDKFYGEGGDQQFMTSLIKKYEGQLNGKNSVLELMNKTERKRYDSIVKETEPKTQKKSNPVLGERQLPDGSRIQKVRVGKGKIEERTVEAPKTTSDQIADALNIPQADRTPTADFQRTERVQQATQKSIKNATPQELQKEMQQERRTAKAPSSIKEKAKRQTFEQVTKEYLGKTKSAQIERSATLADLNKRFKLNDKEKINAILARDDPSVKPMNRKVSEYINEFKRNTDKAYSEYKAQGVKMGYVSSYLPRIYKNPTTGQEIDAVEFKLLQQGSKRMKGREADKVAVDWLVEKDPTKLLERYYNSMDKAVAGRQYLEKLENNGLVTKSTEPVRGLRPIVAEGLQTENGIYYAQKDVATKLNELFGAKEANNLVEKTLEKGAGVNSLFQSFVLSGGVPNTPINAFGIMQVMKEGMALHPIKAGKAFTAGMSKSYANKVFTSKKDIMRKMVENDIDLRVDLTQQGKTGRARIKEAFKDSKAQGINEAWNEFTNDSTFGRFMPMLEVLHFENIYKSAIKRGATEADAGRLAGDSTKNFYGKTGNYKLETRSKSAQDAAGAVFFAPRFRESMVNFWVKNAKALNPKNLGKVEYRDNQKFMVASALTYAAMTMLNEALNGVQLWDNPDGKKDKLIIPASALEKMGIQTKGKDVAIPFLPSLATVPRNAASLVGNFATGKFNEAGKNAKAFLSMPLKTAGDILTNEDYFGNKIVQDDSNPLQKFTQAGSYVAASNMQPWIREGLNAFGQNLPKDVKKTFGIKEKSTFEALSNAGEAPLRFYNPDTYRFGDNWVPKGGKNEKFTFKEQKERAAIKGELNGIAKNVGMNKRQEELFKSLSSVEFNEDGTLKEDNNPFYKSQRYTALQDDKVYEGMKQKAKLNAKLNGKPVDPIFDDNLAPDQRRALLWKKTLPPGTSDPTVKQLYAQDWYQDYRNKESKYFADKTVWNKKMGYEDGTPNTNEYPLASKDVEAGQNTYFDLPKGGARTAFRNNNPQLWNKMVAYWDSKDAWTNGERSKLGLGPLEDEYANTGSGSSFGGSGSRGGRRSGGGKRGGKRGSKYDWTKDLFASDGSKTTKALRKILEDAMRG